MTATLSPSEVQATLGELQRLLPHVDALRADFARAARAPDLAEARARAFELSSEHPEVRAFGALDRVTEQELRDLLAAATPAPSERQALLALLDAIRQAPRLHRALAHVHPFSFVPPGSEAWDAWKASLRALRDQPLWGIPEPRIVPLGAVYIPQRYRVVARRPKAPHEAPTPAFEETEPIAQDLLSKLHGALTSDAGAGAMLLVLGGPGAGKTTLATLLASQLAEDALLQPLLIRLRDVRPEADLLEEVRRALDEAPPEDTAAHALAEHVSRAPRLVLVLDGFDELVHASKLGLGSFFLRLESLLRDQRVHGAVCLGRDTALGRDDATLPERAQVFSLLPFDDAQADAWCERWTKATGRSFSWRTLGVKEAPHEADEDSRALHSLAHEPMTLRVFALLDLEGVAFQDGDGNVDLARIYHRLIQETCRRHAKERGGFSESELRRLLRVLGYAVMQSGREVIRLDDLERALRALSLIADVDKTESKATQLILAISQRRSDRVERAWEFLHKSIGEYLAAEFLAAEVFAMVAVERDEFDELRPKLDDAALCRRWITRFGPALVTPGVERFLRRMAGDHASFLAGHTTTEPDRDLTALAARLGGVYIGLLDEVEAESALTTARAWGLRPTDVLGVALCNVFLVGGLRYGEDVAFAPELCAPGRYTEAYHLMRRATSETAWPRVSGRTEFRGVAEGSDFSGFLLHHSRWTDTHAERITLASAQLHGATLKRSRFELAHCYGTSFEDAMLEAVTFRSCGMPLANLADARITNVTLERCELRGAIFPLRFAPHLPTSQPLQSKWTFVVGASWFKGATYALP